MKNIELKVRVDSLNTVRERILSVEARRSSTLQQVDTYFFSAKGRIKLREINSMQFELIYYERPDIFESKVSSYEIVSLSKTQAEGIKFILEATNGKSVTVKKEREFWLYKNTRIHLDSVAELGEYVELETVVKEISMEMAQIEHDEVVDLLGLGQYKRCDISYGDMHG